MNDAEVDALLDKARQSIKAAELLFNEGFIDFSAGRAYYAMFYCLEALLLDKDLSFSKHSAVISAFGRDFVKTKVFDRKFHQYVLEAFDLRNTGDYGAMHAVPREVAKELLRKTDELLDAIQAYINRYRNSNHQENPSD